MRVVRATHSSRDVQRNILPPVSQPVPEPEISATVKRTFGAMSGTFGWMDAHFAAAVASLSTIVAISQIGGNCEIAFVTGW